MKNEAANILCQLEMYFPPSFFDIMVHLIIHLAREITLCGLAYLRCMHSIKRYMKVLKGHTNNQYHPEASIVERYIVEKLIEFCSEYMEKEKSMRFVESRHDNKWGSKGSQGFEVVIMGHEELN